MNNTERIAWFVVEARYEALPKEAIEIAKQGIIDCLGVTLAACLEPGSRIITEYARKNRGIPESGVIAGGFKAPACEAALANGTMAHMLDYDDVSIPFGGHPSVVLLPAVLALGEKLRSSGKEVLLAYIVGFEVATRIGLACFTHHYELGWHTTATFGTIGAAATAAKLLKLNIDQSRAAFGITASLAGGLKRNFGTMTKPLHAGNAARNGIIAASLAQQGFTGDKSIFDESGNFCYVLGSGVQFDLDRATKDLGQKFNICSGLEIKPYPSCRATHAGIDAALQVKKKYALNPADIKDSAVQELISKTKIVVDPQIPKDALTPVEMKIKLKNGEVLCQKVEAAKGEPKNPLSPEELFTKFRDCASTVLTLKDVEQTLELTSDLESLKEITPLMEILTFRMKGAQEKE